MSRRRIRKPSCSAASTRFTTSRPPMSASSFSREGMVMTPSIQNFLRGASLLAVLAAGSCAAPINDNNGLFDDPTVNHPIQVAPSYRTLKLQFSSADAGLMPDDAQRFDAFVADYMQHGN